MVKGHVPFNDVLADRLRVPFKGVSIAPSTPGNDIDAVIRVHRDSGIFQYLEVAIPLGVQQGVVAQPLLPAEDAQWGVLPFSIMA